MIDLTNEQIEKLFNLAGIKAPEAINSEHISKALIEIEKKLTYTTRYKSSYEPENSPDILIVDDLEISIYQLNLLLTKSGYNVCIARSVEEAKDHYKKQKFDYVLLDLFIPEYEDGFGLLESIVKSEKSKTDNTKVIVMSGTDNHELIGKCLEKGASEFISKSPEWHINILRYLKQLESTKNDKPKMITSNIEDPVKNIATISINQLYNSKIAQELEKEIITLNNSGYSNIIIDMNKCPNIDSKGIGALIFGYTTCAEHGGNLKLINVNSHVAESLSYVHLQNIINSYKDKHDAIDSF